jgi:NAD(P)-dependent dehydrogenase (short-subunit alcohol dehydrogenase family)
MFSLVGSVKFDDLQREHGYTRYGAYAQSKLANILFARELQRRFQEAGIDALSLAAHPGYSATNLQSNSTAHSGSVAEQILYGVLNRVAAQSSAMGALPELYAAASNEVHPGAFYGPQHFYMRGYPREVSPPQAALNQDSARKLWEASEQLTGVSYDFTPIRTKQTNRSDTDR